MDRLRAFLLRHSAFAALLVAAALCIRAMVPAGYMPSHSKMLMVEICADTTGDRITKQVVIPMERADGRSGDHGQGKGDCAFTSLAYSALGGADSALLAAAFAFILALGVAFERLHLSSRHRDLRPPLRGPPAAA